MTRLRFITIILAMSLVLLAMVGLGGVGCSSCRDSHIAEVKKHKGDVKRDTAKTLEKWEGADDGAKLSAGDGLKTGPSSEAVVRMTSGGSIAISSDTTIRFHEVAPGSSQPPKLSVETGEASIEADDKALSVQTTIGLAQIEPGGKLRLSAGENGSTRVEVTVGGARLETDDGGVALAPGKSFEVALGGAIMERDPSSSKGDASVDSGSKREAVVVVETDDAGAGQVALFVKGAGVRLQSKAIGEGAATGAAGDVLEIPIGSSVEVRKGSRRTRLVGGRHVLGGEAGGDATAPLVRSSGGHLEIEATSDDVVVEVPGGAIVVKAAPDGKSRTDADIGGNGTKVTARQGHTEVRGKGTSVETIRAGETATLSSKGAIVLSTKGPERADFTVRAGDSLIVRDPHPPTALGVDFSAACPGSAVVSRADGTSVRGEKRAAIFMPAGHHEYSVRCIGADGVEEKPAATGAVTIIPDAARAELARLPPSTVVDMDGRRYTVLYQNQLPSVIARWPDAPQAGNYVLFIDKDKTKAPAPAKQSLKSGSVGEGTHTMHFETEDGSKKSAETTLVIKFDNAAPAASVRDPVDGSFQPGDTVKVSGVVVEGWTVSVNGAAVPLDEQKRFNTTATVPATESGLVLRLSHPKRGTVYYVRHAASSR